MVSHARAVTRACRAHVVLVRPRAWFRKTIFDLPSWHMLNLSVGAIFNERPDGSPSSSTSGHKQMIKRG